MKNSYPIQSYDNSTALAHSVVMRIALQLADPCRVTTFTEAAVESAIGILVPADGKCAESMQTAFPQFMITEIAEWNIRKFPVVATLSEHGTNRTTCLLPNEGTEHSDFVYDPAYGEVLRINNCNRYTQAFQVKAVFPAWFQNIHWYWNFKLGRKLLPAKEFSLDEFA